MTNFYRSRNVGLVDVDDPNIKANMDENGNYGVIPYDDNGNVVKISRDIEGGGKVAVGTTPVEVTFSGLTKTIIIRPDKDNDGILYVGKSDVTSAGDNALTYLEVEDSLTINFNDVDVSVWVVADRASQNFWKGALLQ